MKRFLLLFISLAVKMICIANSNVPFTLSGLQDGDKVSVTISSNEYLNTMTITADGDYSFTDVPTGGHAIKVEAIGYNLPDSKTVNVNEDGTIEPFMGIKLVITTYLCGKSWIKKDTKILHSYNLTCTKSTCTY